MEHIQRTDEIFKWLKIKLNVEKNNTDGIIMFHVDFINRDKNYAHELKFSNRSAKAEFMCLSIFDCKGNALLPQRREIPRLINTKPDSHVIEPNGAWRFDLKARLLDNGWLEFTGAAYLLQEKETYSFEFEYGEIHSNRCTLQL